jgi:hypothetical protein
VGREPVGGLSSEGIHLCFTQLQSLQKLDAIATHHPRIFRALHDFVANEQSNLLTILPGNHDVDLFWPAIRSRFAELVGATSGDRGCRLRFRLQQHYRPDCLLRVWIEHGHQHDPINSFYVDGRSLWSEACPPILSDSTGVLRLYECIGTRFLIRFLNRIDATYPFVNNVKPFSRLFDLYLKSSLVPGFGPFQAAVAAWAMMRFVGQSLRTAPSDLLHSGESPALPPPDLWLKAHVATMSQDTREAFAAHLAEHGFPARVPLPMLAGDRERAEELLAFLAEHPEVLDSIPAVDPSELSLEGDAGLLALSRGFLNDESELLRAAARSVLKLDEGITTVVMGHTHEPIVDLPAYQVAEKLDL